MRLSVFLLLPLLFLAFSVGGSPTSTSISSSATSTAASSSTSTSSATTTSFASTPESLQSSDSNVTFAEREKSANSSEIQQCFCSEVAECKLSAYSVVGSCFDECDSELNHLGNDTESYVDCFQKEKYGFHQAEQCLVETFDEFCAPGNDTVFIPSYDYKQYLNATFVMNAEPPKQLRLRRKTHHALATFQQFFHCAKNCVHKRMMECLDHKGCTVRLPSVDTFSATMSSCARSNPLATSSLRSACLCLLHKKKVTHLAGTCALMGSAHFVKIL